MDPIMLLEDYLAHRLDAPRPSAEPRPAHRLLAEPADQPLTQALAEHQKPAAAAGRRIA